MQTQASSYLEYRCTHCWNSNVAASDATGVDATCKYCGRSNVVPEATAERIERALALLEQQPELLEETSSEKSKAFHFDRELSDQEMYEIAKQNTITPLLGRNFRGYSDAALWRRFLAFLIDFSLFNATIVLGFAVVILASKHGFAIENPIDQIRFGRSLKPATWILLGIIPASFCVIQWFLISVSGQSIGKKLTLIRIVDDQGWIPGFVCGVVMRNWIPGLICLIPGVGAYWYFIDALFLFFTGKKCAHDYLARTRVVSLFH